MHSVVYKLPDNRKLQKHVAKNIILTDQRVLLKFEFII